MDSIFVKAEFCACSRSHYIVLSSGIVEPDGERVLKGPRTIVKFVQFEGVMQDENDAAKGYSFRIVRAPQRHRTERESGVIEIREVHR